MKYFTFLLFLSLLIGSEAKAQKWGGDDITFPVAEVKDANGVVTEIKEAPRNVGRVQGTVGAIYTSEMMTNLPSRNVNKISSMTLGVQWNYGQEPIFKGAPGGTAYFVDGIRIRSGSLAIAGMSF